MSEWKMSVGDETKPSGLCAVCGLLTIDTITLHGRRVFQCADHVVIADTVSTHEQVISNESQGSIQEGVQPRSEGNQGSSREDSSQEQETERSQSHGNALVNGEEQEASEQEDDQDVIEEQRRNPNEEVLAFLKATLAYVVEAKRLVNTISADQTDIRFIHSRVHDIAFALNGAMRMSCSYFGHAFESTIDGVQVCKWCDEVVE